MKGYFGELKPSTSDSVATISGSVPQAEKTRDNTVVFAQQNGDVYFMGVVANL